MCGRFTSSQRPEAIGERFEVVVPETYQERFNLAPAQRTLIVRERDEGREAVMAKWGLLPHWAKDAKIAFKTINARAERLTEKPAYRGTAQPAPLPRSRGGLRRVDGEGAQGVAPLGVPPTAFFYHPRRFRSEETAVPRPSPSGGSGVRVGRQRSVKPALLVKLPAQGVSSSDHHAPSDYDHSTPDHYDPASAPATG
jgi:SOS response associated peptidase (SRAP)